MKKIIKIKAPTRCIVGELSKVPDAIFSKKQLGDGLSIYPLDGNFYAPVDGKVEVVFPTGHAQIYDHDGLKILMHIGIDTVKLDGKGFDTLIQKESKVKSGKTHVCDVDLKLIQPLALSLITPIILVEHESKVINIHKVHIIENGEVQRGTTIAFVEYTLK